VKVDFSFWRFVVLLNVSKSWTWGKGQDTWLFHIGTFTDGKVTALRIVLFPFNLSVGIKQRPITGEE